MICALNDPFLSFWISSFNQSVFCDLCFVLSVFFSFWISALNRSGFFYFELASFLLRFEWAFSFWVSSLNISDLL